MEGALPVRAVMTSAVKTSRPDASASELVRKMNRFGVGSIVVIQGERPVGIITERDILRKIVELGLDPETTTAKEIMSTPLLTISEDASVEEAAELMVKRGLKKLPVIHEGKLIGIVTTTDLVRGVPKLLSAYKELLGVRERREAV